MLYKLVEQKFKDATALFNTRMDHLEKILQRNDTIFNSNASQIECDFPLKSIDGVNTFEAKLMDAQFFKTVRLNLLKLNGAGQPWRPAAYKLCNFLFTK